MFFNVNLVLNIINYCCQTDIADHLKPYFSDSRDL